MLYPNFSAFIDPKKKEEHTCMAISTRLLILIKNEYICGQKRFLFCDEFQIPIYSMNNGYKKLIIKRSSPEKTFIVVGDRFSSGQLLHVGYIN